MGRYRKWIIGIAVFFVLFTIVGFFAVPPLVKPYLLETLSKTLNRQVSLADMSFNPYTLKATLRGFEIKEPNSDKTFVSFDELVVNLDVRSVFKRAPIIEEIALRKPYARLVRNKDKTYNFSDLLALKKDEPKDESKEPMRFSVSNIVIENGGADFVDGPFDTTHTVREMNIGIPFISNIPEYVDTFVQPRFAAVVNGDPYSLEGKTKVFKDSRDTIINIVIEDLDIPFYLAYVPHDFNISVPSGKLDVQSTVTFSMSPDRHPAVSVAGNLALRDFALQDRKKNAVAALKRLDVVMTSLEPLQSKFHFAKIALDSFELNVRRAKDGTINLLTLAPAKKEETKAAANTETKGEAKPEDKPLPTLILDDFDLKGGRITYLDEVPEVPINSMLQDIAVKGEKISTVKDSQGKLSLSMDLNKGMGAVAVGGPVGLNPIFASLDVDLKRIRIRPFQEYFTDKFRVNFTDGDISAKGTFSAGKPAGKDLSVSYDGNLLLARVATVDKVNGDDFVKFKSLFVNSVRAGYNPLFVRIKDMALTDLYARIIVNDGGSLNLQNVAKPEAAEGEEAAEAEPEQPEKKEEQAEPGEKKEYVGDVLAKNIEVNRIALLNGTIVFDDRNVKPNYSATLTELTGRVTGVTSITTKPADVDLRGKIGRYIPVEIAGKVHPFKDNLFVDLKASLRDFNLSPLTPYAGTYAGYKIEKGSLSFDLNYHIVDKKLDAENKVVIDQLTLGDRVESPKATKLPVGLAITLLRDADGKINLDIPVTGRIDDPEFSVWRIVLQVIVNLLTKVATAPFALLGSLFGGGEELSYIEFDAGSAVLSEPNLKKVETLVKALKAKPALKLDIVGGVDLERDREGLIRDQFQKKLKAQKMNDLVRKGEKVESVDAITIEPQEYDRYLKRAYGAEKFPKPRNVIGLEKGLPNEEMEKLMLTHIVVKEDDLRLLAMKRAETVADAIRTEGQFDAGRVFVIEPKTLQPEDKKDVKRSRVDFRLK